MQRWFALIVAFVVAGCTAVTPADAQSSSSEPPLIAGRVAVADGDAQIWRVEEDNSPASGMTPSSTTSSARAPDSTRAAMAATRSESGRTHSASAPTAAAASASSTTPPAVVQSRVRHTQCPSGTARARGNDLGDGRRRPHRPGRAGPLSHRRDRPGADAAHRVRGSRHGAIGQQRNRRQQQPGHRRQPGRRRFNFEQPVVHGVRQWALDRDAQYQQVRSVQYVSPYMTGYEQLDTHGDWVVRRQLRRRVVPARRPGGWAPYRYGQLALGPAVGLDLGRSRAVGLCALPLRALGDGRTALGLGAGRVRAPAGVGPCAGGLRRSERRRLGGHRRPGGRLVSARTVAPLRAALSPQPRYTTIINQTIIKRRRAACRAT